MVFSTSWRSSLHYSLKSLESSFFQTQINKQGDSKKLIIVCGKLQTLLYRLHLTKLICFHVILLFLLKIDTGDKAW